MEQQISQTDDSTPSKPLDNILTTGALCEPTRCRTLRRSTDDDIQSKYDSLSKSQYYGNPRISQHWKDKVFRRNRCRTNFKPYEHVDNVNFSRLSISPVKKQSHDPLKPTTTESITKENLPTPIITRPKNKMLIHPSKFHVSSPVQSKSQNQDNSQSAQTKTFDFASLAEQVKQLDCNAKHQSSSFGDWKNLRATLSPQKSSELTISPRAEIETDGFDELSTLSNLSLRTDGLAEAPIQSRLSGSSPRTGGSNTLIRSCSQEAMLNELDFSADELAYYFDELVQIPKKMSEMAETMYT